MEPRMIERHVIGHYDRLFGGDVRCRVPITRGRELALALGYPPEAVALVPDFYWDLFHPCGNPLRHLDTRSGDRVLNLGCGVGIDSIVLLCRASAPARVVNLDPTPNALREGRNLAHHVGLASDRLHWVRASGEFLPFPTGSFNAAILNGVFNLFPDKTPVLRELHRVLRPGGLIAAADLCAVEDLPDYFRDEPDAWVWCMGGALTETALAELLANHGFDEIVLVPEEEGDPFHRVAFHCRRPAGAGSDE